MRGGGGRLPGYTIVEVMIFLAVSGAMFAGAVTALNLQNRRTAFSESVKTFEQRLQDVMNDVETGFYPSNSDFKCTASSDGPSISFSGAVEQGKNEGCTFVGKAIQLSPEENPDQFNVYTLVGLRGLLASTGTIEDAKPKALEASGSIQSGVLSAGVQVHKVLYLDDRGAISNSSGGGFAIITGFAQSAGAGLRSGSIRTSLATITASALNQSQSNFLSASRDIKSVDIVNGSNGILICLNDGPATNARRASILIGADRQQLATQAKFDNAQDSRCNS